MVGGLVLAACTYGVSHAEGFGSTVTSPGPVHSTTPASSGGHHAGPRWGYSGSTGPDHWGDLGNQFELCKKGATQSPIDIKPNLLATGAEVDVDYSVSGLEVLNNGHTIQFNYDPGSYLTVNGEPFQLAQFHGHAPSEHTIDGRSYPLELHFVHKSDNGSLAVIGVLFVEGKENIALEELWQHLPRREGKANRVERVAINGRDLFPRERSFYRYMGSLTTPPCSEGVNWFVLDTPVEISANQIKRFREIMQDNNRPVQTIGNRLIVQIL